MQRQMLTQRSEKILLFVIGLIFLIKLGDSLYIRQHGDALNYHLYAPLNWARFGWNYVNSFQATAWQSGLLEGVVTIFFKIWTPLEIPQREFFLVLMQVLSCIVGYLGIPLILYFRLRKQMSVKGLWLVIAGFYGMEILTFTWAFAKNDSWAAMFFLLGFFSTSFWGAIFLALACGLKQTYLFGAFFWLLLNIKREKPRAMVAGLILIGAFPALLWLKAYWATGNPFFPIRSGPGVQVSQWLLSYFDEYAGRSTMEQAVQKLTFVLVRAPFLILFGPLAFWSMIRLRSLTWAQRMFPAILVWYLLFTGKFLELRTYSGVVFAIFAVMVQQFDGFWLSRSRWIYYVLIVLALATSKIDPSSWNRFQSAQGKGFAELVRDGRTFAHINSQYSEKDAVLTELTNEGYFLIPQILTVNEHPARDEIRAKFPLLDAHSNMIAIRLAGDCPLVGESPNFVRALLRKSEADLRPDTEMPVLFHLELNCEVP